MPNLYKRKDSPYWWCWGHYTNGERWQQSTRQRSRRAAEKAARAIERERLDETDSGYPAVPLRAAMETLRKHKQRRGVSASTLQILADKRARLEEHFGEERDVLTITLADTERYIDARRRDLVPHLNDVGEREDKPTSDHTIAKEMGILRQALRVLKRHDLYPGDPGDIWPDSLAGAYTPRDRWLTVDEYRRLLAALQPRRVKYVTLYCHTGMRASELYRCRREGDAVIVRQTKGKRRRDRKTVVERIIPLSTDALRVLDAEPLPWSHWSASNMHRDLGIACERAGIERATANDFRRTFCSWLVQAGVPELTIIRLMGHASSDMVRRVYAQLAPETLVDAIARLPSVANT